MEIPTITIADAHASADRACQAHTGWPLHTDADCGKLAGVRPFSDRTQCSVCDLDWGIGLVSQHESCASLGANGARTYAHPIIYALRGDEEVIIATETQPIA